MTTLLVTGATGTFGHAFLPAAIKSGRFERIVAFSRDEHKQFHFRQELGDPKSVRWMLGDIRDRDRLLLAFRGVECVVHSAALKHVIASEYNPMEFVQTNVFGSQNVIRAAIDCGVRKVLALSTDKAVAPINLYGFAKGVMERLVVSSNVYSPGTTRLSCVRYGNVIGSRGSFIETLKALRSVGAKTFPLRSLDSTRFWMDADDAAQFVLDRLDGMQGEEIFVPRLPASTALEFARQYLPDAEPEIVGVPVGEKIHETLISEAESQYTTDCGDYFEIRPRAPRDESVVPWSYTSNQQAAVLVA